MGGFGSGKQRERGLVTEHRFLDIGWMNKQGWFRDKVLQGTGWQRNVKAWGTISVIIEEDHILLAYKKLRNDGTWKEVDLSVQYLKSPCHFGGFHYWFVCPIRQRLAGKLYLVDTWCCRKCGHLAYPTENQNKQERLQHKVKKLKKILGKECYIRPKGMHRQTYSRLINRYLEARQGINDGIRKRIEGIFGESVWENMP